MFTEQLIPCGDVALNVATTPAGRPPLLLLHGVMRRWQDFLPLAPALSFRWQFHALDGRGHGRSDRAERYRVVDYAADVCAYLRNFQTPVVIYGHSLGALVAAAVAAELPRAVRAVVLEDPPGPNFLRDSHSTAYGEVFLGMWPFAGDARDTGALARALAGIPVGKGRLGDLRDATALRFTARCLRDLDANVLTPILECRWLEGYDVPAVFGAIRCPALLLRADTAVGGMLSADEGRLLASHLADGTMIDVPHVGHLLHWVAPETVLRLTVGFLESL